MKMFFEGDSVITTIKNQLLMHDRISKAPLTDLFLNPVEGECLAVELQCEVTDVAEAFNAIEGFEKVKLHILLTGAS